MSSPPIAPIKVTTVGEAAVGKTCLLMTFSAGVFPGQYVPTVFDNYQTNVMVKSEKGQVAVQLNLWDTAGDEENSRLRPLAYPQTDLFLCAFSVVEPKSLDKIKELFLSEIEQYVKPFTWLLVGTKLDLRNDSDIKHRLRKKGLKPISKEKGQQIAQEWGAAGYQECSALTSKGVQSVFQRAIEIVIAERKKNGGKKGKGKSGDKGGCVIV